jgi:hypothetical protein
VKARALNSVGGASGGRDALGGAGQVEQVSVFGVVGLQRPRDWVLEA